MSKERFKLISAVHLFLIKDDKILLLRRFNTGYKDGNYSVIAGHIDGNEGASAAMAREAKEEAGIIVNVDDISLIHVMHRKSTDERMDLFFLTDVWQGEIMIKEPDKCDELKWFSISELPDNIISYISFAIENFKNKNFFSEFGWE